MAKKIQIAKKVAWVAPYLECAKHLYPSERLLKITCRSMNKKTTQVAVATTTTEDNNKTFRIHLLLSRQGCKVLKNGKTKMSFRRFTKLEILAHLAHELAHMIHWDHTVERQILESRIIIEFMYQLSREGYISEEHEEKSLPFQQEVDNLKSEANKL